MRKICVPCALLFCGAILPAADLWTGQLLDTGCVEHHTETEKYHSCIPGTQTTQFALQVSGRMLILDDQGDRKAAQALKQYLSHPPVIDPDRKTEPVTATVDGTVNGDRIAVHSIELL